MNKFAINYDNLDDSLRPKKPVYKYEDVKHRLTKVAFDVVRFVDSDNIDGLWKVQSTDDGEVIVAMYDESSLISDIEKSSSWKAVPDSVGNVNVFYKNSPVTKVSLAKLGMAGEDAKTVSDVLSEKLETSDNLKKAFFAELSTKEREELFNNFPELRK